MPRNERKQKFTLIIRIYWLFAVTLDMIFRFKSHIIKNIWWTKQLKKWYVPVMERTSGCTVTDFILSEIYQLSQSLYMYIRVICHQCSPRGYSYRSIILIWPVWVWNPLVKYSGIGIQAIRYCSANTHSGSLCTI